MLYYVTENVVNTYQIDALDEQDAIEKVQIFGVEAIVATIEWSAELAVPEETLETRCKRLEAKLEDILARLSGAGK